MRQKQRVEEAEVGEERRTLQLLTTLNALSISHLDFTYPHNQPYQGLCTNSLTEAVELCLKYLCTFSLTPL